MGPLLTLSHSHVIFKLDLTKFSLLFQDIEQRQCQVVNASRNIALAKLEISSLEKEMSEKKFASEVINLILALVFVDQNFFFNFSLRLGLIDLNYLRRLLTAGEVTEVVERLALVPEVFSSCPVRCSFRKSAIALLRKVV